MFIAWIIIIAAVAIGLIIGISNGMKTKKLAEEGKIIHRQSSFWESKEFFTTSATYKQIKEKIRDNSFDSCPVSIQFDNNGRQSVLFKSGTWSASLDCLDTQGDKEVFRFNFLQWDTRRGIPYGLDSMNVLMTTIEKIFLSIDPATTVETRKMEVKSKTKFF